MEYEGANNQPNANTAAVAQEMMNNLTAPPPEKKPSKLSSILDKLKKSPLLIGKRKFVTLPLFALALAAIIIVPIVIINIANINDRPPLNPLDDPAFMSWVEDYAQSIQTALDDNNGDIEEALKIVNNALATEYNPPRRRVLLNDKATLVASNDRFDEAITAMQEFVDFATNENNAREGGIGYLASLYYRKGDKQKALELYQQALDIAIETESYQGNSYYISMIDQIKRELNGAEQ